MTNAPAHQRRYFRRWWVLPVLAALSLLGVAAWGLVAHQPHLPSAGPAPAWVKPERVAATRVAGRPTRSAPAEAPAPVMPAVLPRGAESIQIPSLQISARAQPEGATAGSLAVPSNPADVGWWMPSTSELVIDGHVDMEGVGPGALYEVRNLRPGGQVVVQTSGGPERWTIGGVRTYTKGHIPAGLFRWQGATARLVIITCGGPFDYATHHYYDNVVAYGSPAGS
jgi:hypothetical protein